MERFVLLGIALIACVIALIMVMVAYIQHDLRLRTEERNRALMKRLQQRNKEAAKTVARYELNCFFMQERSEELEKALKRKDAILNQKWKDATGIGEGK
jgi:predicted Holliday junction resolvase-like endonuclease